MGMREHSKFIRVVYSFFLEKTTLHSLKCFFLFVTIDCIEFKFLNR